MISSRNDTDALWVVSVCGPAFAAGPLAHREKERLLLMGEETFPSNGTYLFAQHKIRQTTLFQLLKIAHPETKVYCGPRQQTAILSPFCLSLIAKGPGGPSRGRGSTR